MWMPLIMLTLSTAVVASLNVSVVDNQFTTNSAIEAYYETAVSEVGAGVEHFLMENARFPVDLAELFSQKPELRSYSDVISFAAVTRTDPELDRQYQKAVVFVKSDRDISDADWLASNDCGAQPFGDGASQFCKKDGSVFAETDDRAYQQYLASETVVRLDYLAQQVFNGRTLNGAFPGTTAAAVEMADGDVVTLASAVGFVGTTETCSGIFNFDGAVFSCEFLFSLTGSPVYYIREDDSNVVLYVELPVLHIDGEPHRIARPLRVL